MKKYLIVGALVIAFVLPSISSAATLEELQAQINALLAQIQQLQTQLAQVQGTSLIQWCHDFNVNLKIGDRGSEVAALQQALEKEGFQISTEIELGPASVFNEAIASAVTGFQEKYKNEILTPLSLQYGTGFVGTATRAKLNRLYGCNVLPFLFPSPTPSITVISPNGGESIPTGLDNYIIRYSVSSIGQIINPGIRIDILQNGIVLGYRCVSSSGVCGVSRDPTNWNFSWDVGSYTNADGSTYQKASVGAGYQIRVVLFDGNIEIARDTSNAPFNIIATALTQPFTVLSSPNGGEQWQIGGTYTIRWNTTLDASKAVQIGLVDTRYSSEVGARGEAIIAFSTSNTGSYNWTIPAMLGTMNLTVTNQPVYKIKLYVDGGGSGKFDDSDAAFSIAAATTTTQPTITVLSPNGGETWAIGSTQTISWSSANAPSGSWVALYLTGISGHFIVQGLPTTGSYSWQIPTQYCSGDTCGHPFLPDNNSKKIDARLYTGPSLCIGLCPPTTQPTLLSRDYSDATFSIAAAGNQAPRIISATFDGNGVVIQGERLTGSYVAFVAPSSGALCREMITPNCVLQKTLSTDTTIKFNSNWIGGEGSYQIYVENPTIGESNKVYMIISSTPTITVLSPNGGESWIISSTQTVLWNSSGIPSTNSVKIVARYYTDSIPYSNNYQDYVLKETTPNDGSESVSLTSLSAGVYTLQIKTSYNDVVYNDWSNFYFRIVSTTPTITVLSPNGGEQLIKGQTFDIRWSSQNIPAGTLVTVSLYHGATGSRRNQFVSIANDGIERWTINSPEAEDSTYKITLEAGCNSYGTNCLVTDQSDVAFSIAAAVSQSTSLSILSVSPFIFPSKNIIVGSTGIEVAKFTLTTGSAADANISSIQLKSTNTAVCSSLQNLKLYVDASQIGQTIPVLDSSCTATFGNLSWVLLKSISKDITLKLDVANSAQVGSNFSFQLSGITSSNAQVSGLGATSGAIMTIAAAAVSQSSLDQMASILNSIQETLNKIREALKNL